MSKFQIIDASKMYHQRIIDHICYTYWTADLIVLVYLYTGIVPSIDG